MRFWNWSKRDWYSLCLLVVAILWMIPMLGLPAYVWWKNMPPRIAASVMSVSALCLLGMMLSFAFVSLFFGEDLGN